MDSLADSELMVKCAAGDAEAFDVLMRRHQEQLLRWIWGMLKNREEAAEVAQDAFLQAYNHRKQYNPKLNFKTWLFTIGRNRAISVLRKRGKQVFLHATTDEDGESGGFDDWAEKAVDESPDPRKRAASAEDAEWLRRGLERLDEAHREVLTMKYLQGMKSRDIADVLGLEVGTVWSRVHNGLKKMRAVMEEVRYER